jgi:hypothetical protein
MNSWFLGFKDESLSRNFQNTCEFKTKIKISNKNKAYLYKLTKKKCEIYCECTPLINKSQTNIQQWVRIQSKNFVNGGKLSCVWKKHIRMRYHLRKVETLPRMIVKLFLKGAEYHAYN